MKYNINHEHQVIIFWLPKSGVMSLVKWMIHLKLGSVVDGAALAREPIPSVYRIFRNTVLERERPQVDYSSFRKIFFGRNPFHRVVSCYLDKYVCRSSSTPKDNPESANYLQFLERLTATRLRREKMKGVVDFGHFCAATNDIGWDFYLDLGQPKFDFISIVARNRIA